MMLLMFIDGGPEFEGFGGQLHFVRFDFADVQDVADDAGSQRAAASTLLRQSRILSKLSVPRAMWDIPVMALMGVRVGKLVKIVVAINKK